MVALEVTDDCGLDIGTRLKAGIELMPVRAGQAAGCEVEADRVYEDFVVPVERGEDALVRPTMRAKIIRDLRIVRE